MLNDLLSMIPIIIAALLGSFSQDFTIYASYNRPIGKLSIRFGKVVISIIVTVAIVGFGGSFFSITKDMDWKIISFISFIISFTGYRISEFLSKTLGGLTLIGQDKLANAMELENAKQDLLKASQQLKAKDTPNKDTLFEQNMSPNQDTSSNPESPNTKSSNQ